MGLNERRERSELGGGAKEGGGLKLPWMYKRKVKSVVKPIKSWKETRRWKYKILFSTNHAKLMFFTLLLVKVYNIMLFLSAFYFFKNIKCRFFIPGKILHFWPPINFSWNHFSCHKKFWPYRFRPFDVFWIQNHPKP